MTITCSTFKKNLNTFFQLFRNFFVEHVPFLPLFISMQILSNPFGVLTSAVLPWTIWMSVNAWKRVGKGIANSLHLSDWPGFTVEQIRLFQVRKEVKRRKKKEQEKKKKDKKKKKKKKYNKNVGYTLYVLVLNAIILKKKHKKT